MTIPAVRITQADGDQAADSLAHALAHARRACSRRSAVAGTQYAGADPLGRAQMFAPNPYLSGSSVSHFDRTMFRNQLMEPTINADLTQSLMPPEDMTFPLLQDIGW